MTRRPCRDRLSVPDAQDPYALSVPADPAGLSTVRVFLRAVARTIDAEPERCDDLELIVSEVGAALVEGAATAANRGPGRRGRVRVAVDADGPPSAPEDNGIRGDLLGTLAPDTTWTDHGARFSLSLEPGGEGSAQAR